MEQDTALIINTTFTVIETKISTPFICRQTHRDFTVTGGVFVPSHELPL